MHLPDGVDICMLDGLVHDLAIWHCTGSDLQQQEAGETGTCLPVHADSQNQQQEGETRTTDQATVIGFCVAGREADAALSVYGPEHLQAKRQSLLQQLMQHGSRSLCRLNQSIALCLYTL